MVLFKGLLLLGIVQWKVPVFFQMYLLIQIFSCNLLLRGKLFFHSDYYFYESWADKRKKNIRRILFCRPISCCKALFGWKWVWSGAISHHKGLSFQEHLCGCTEHLMEAGFQYGLIGTWSELEWCDPRTVSKWASMWGIVPRSSHSHHSHFQEMGAHSSLSSWYSCVLAPFLCAEPRCLWTYVAWHWIHDHWLKK